MVLILSEILTSKLLNGAGFEMIPVPGTTSKESNQQWLLSFLFYKLFYLL